MSNYKIVVLCVFLFLNSPILINGQILPLVDYIQSWFLTHEMPPHTTLRSIVPNVEERIYTSQKWACTQEFSTALKVEEKRPDMFFKLFAYTDGKNSISKKIQMTIPINTLVDHRNGDLNSYEMCIYLPKYFQENPPKPADPAVKIISRPEMRVYVKTFGGYAGESNFMKEMVDLSNILRNEGISFIEQDMGSRAIHYTNIYDAPAKFWNRRNEVWLLASTIPA